MVSFITVLLIFSVLSAGASHPLSYEQNDDENGPPDIDPPIPGRIGRFDGTEGDFVSFEIIDDGISDHFLDDGPEIFEKIVIEDLGMYRNRDIGHRYEIKGNGVEIQIYDSSTPLIKVDVEPIESEREVSFKLGDMEILDDRRGQSEIGPFQMEFQGYSGSLMSVDHEDLPAEADGEYINYTIQDRKTFIFRMERNDFEEEMIEFIRDGISQAKVGGEYRIVSDDDTGYQQMAISYRDLDIQANMKGENTLEMMVSSETLGTEGTILVLEISSTVMDISTQEDVRIDFNEEKASLAENYDDLEGSDEPSYLVEVGEEDAYIFVNVPHFSTNTITIQPFVEIPEEFLGSLIYYIPAAAASIGIVISGLIYRKHSKKQ